MEPDALTPKVLADIIQDFLEMNCKLAEKDRAYLVRELSQESLTSEAIEVHPAFSVDGKIIVVKNSPAMECWVYAPKARKITKAKWNCA